MRIPGSPSVTARDRSIPNAAWSTLYALQTASELAFYCHPMPGQTGSCHLVMARIWHDTDRRSGWVRSGHGERR